MNDEAWPNPARRDELLTLCREVGVDCDDPWLAAIEAIKKLKLACSLWVEHCRRLAKEKKE